MPAGRRSKYEQLGGDAVVPLLAQDYARQGLTEEQIAKKLGIGTTTLYRWKTEFREFREALKEGKRPVDVEVENALLKRALGYEYEERKIVAFRDENGEAVQRVEKTKKQVVPDVTAQIYWTANRRPDRWRRNPEPEGDQGGRGEIARLFDELRKDEEADAAGEAQG